MSLVFGPQQKIVLIGDSITDCGRRNEPFAPYGAGYVMIVRALLLARYPELGLEVVNRGIGGNTVRDLARRWDEDVIAEQPDWLSVKIGINDVWRTMSGRHTEAVPLEEFRSTYHALLERTRQETQARLILMEPYVIAPPVTDSGGEGQISLQEAQQRYPELRQQNVVTGPELEAVMRHFRAMMDEFIGAVRELAAEFGALLVPTQGAFDEVLGRQPPVFWAADRVHPGAPGHAVIARAFLRTAGYGDV
ncbi:MAG TPA: SGNH/GDSL hydrolase family protein [Chloroflexota bacterium]|nr:SGNH/GDSL hydrolase family protein [Chloroflexota bacterium]